MSAIEAAREFLKPMPGVSSTLHINGPHAQVMINEYDTLAAEVAEAKKRIRRGWSDHMWNFEDMLEPDEAWLLCWSGHPSGLHHREHHGDECRPGSEHPTPEDVA